MWFKLPQEAVGFCEKLTEEANYNAMLGIGSFLRGEVQRRMRSAAVNVAHDLCQASLKQDGFTRLHGRQICRLLESWPRRPPETVVPVLKLYYQRRKIQPPAGDRRTKVVLAEKENPAASWRRPLKY